MNIDTIENVDPMPKKKEKDSSCGSNIANFDAFFRTRPEGKVLIALQHTPDPDAIGSALGLEWLLEQEYGLQSDIFYSGQISHPQNQTEINVLDIRLRHKDDLTELDKYSTFVTLDTVPQNTGFSDIIQDWHLTIDHHHSDSSAQIQDIRNCGACTSIIWEYLKHFEMDFTTERGMLVATAMLFGLVNDTHHLLTENVSELDLRAHADLIQHIDRKKFHNIIHHPLPPYLFELRALAARNMVSEASILISYLGILSHKRRDALPIMADEFLRMEGVETVVVFCLIEGYIHASVRSRNSSVNVHQFCQRVFGVEDSGGKHGAGGAKVPVGFLYSQDDDIEDQSRLSEFAKDTVTKRIIRHLSGA